jgi:hypothetical protein
VFVEKLWMVSSITVMFIAIPFFQHIQKTHPLPFRSCLTYWHVWKDDWTNDISHKHNYMSYDAVSNNQCLIFSRAMFPNQWDKKFSYMKTLLDSGKCFFCCGMFSCNTFWKHLNKFTQGYCLTELFLCSYSNNQGKVKLSVCLIN